ncbi:hypothetical protein HHK36_007069 [Tetracentron sinense]|uniref:BHLH domain-containing protein n=2 Tax=Tetracentron sinense TaxID=13715 RepID=A0A835DPM4_TETSI|nr:hypothetical protein HHK36_007069 [Tetracentron sinense]
MKTSCSALSKLDRKIVEKNRRTHMKGLCFKLTSLIPPTHHFNSSKDIISQQDQLDCAAIYIKQLQNRIEELKRRKELAMSVKGISKNIRDSMTMGLRLPVIELRDLGTTLEVILISGLNKNFMFYEVISVLEEEGAEVMNASFSVVGDKVFHTIHSQVTSSRVGIETSRVCERLKELVH